MFKGPEATQNSIGGFEPTQLLVESPDLIKGFSEVHRLASGGSIETFNDQFPLILSEVRLATYLDSALAAETADVASMEVNTERIDTATVLSEDQLGDPNVIRASNEGENNSSRRAATRFIGRRFRPQAARLDALLEQQLVEGEDAFKLDRPRIIGTWSLDQDPSVSNTGGNPLIRRNDSIGVVNSGGIAAPEKEESVARATAKSALKLAILATDYAFGTAVFLGILNKLAPESYRDLKGAAICTGLLGALAVKEYCTGNLANGMTRFSLAKYKQTESTQNCHDVGEERGIRLLRLRNTAKLIGKKALDVVFAPLTLTGRALENAGNYLEKPGRNPVARSTGKLSRDTGLVMALGTPFTVLAEKERVDGRLSKKAIAWFGGLFALEWKPSVYAFSEIIHKGIYAPLDFLKNHQVPIASFMDTSAHDFFRTIGEAATITTPLGQSVIGGATVVLTGLAFRAELSQKRHAADTKMGINLHSGLLASSPEPTLSKK